MFQRVIFGKSEKMEEMEKHEYIVCDKDCSANKIVSIASKLESSSDFSDPKGWPKLATFLETPTTLRKQYEKDLLLNLKGGMDVFHGLLIEWRARRSKDATLTKLLEGLETCGWTDIADELRSEFNVQVAT